MHQPGLELRVDWHVRRSVAVGKCGGDPAAQDFRVAVECLAALAVETQAGHDFHDECSPPWSGSPLPLDDKRAPGALSPLIGARCWVGWRIAAAGGGSVHFDSGGLGIRAEEGREGKGWVSMGR